LLDAKSIDHGNISWSALKALAHRSDWHKATAPEQTLERIADAEPQTLFHPPFTIA
jgi:hypothetical protein